MLLKKIHDMIRAGRLLGGIDPAHLRTLLSLAQEIDFKEGEVIFQEGDKSSYLYLLISGDVALELSTGSGSVRVQTLGPGDAVGWSTLTTGQHAHFSARALSAVSTVALPGDDLLSLCDHNPEIGYVLMRRLLELITDRLDSTRLQLVRHTLETQPAVGR
jgi:CRP/FNR family cyclic AMP-dependent transcriptional regulator